MSQFDLATPEGTISFMGQSESDEDWNVRLEKLKSSHNGQLPPFWSTNSVMWGIFAEIGRTHNKSKAINGNNDQ